MVFGPTQVFTKENVKARWLERYTSDAINKKFLGIPRGIYLGFVPSQSGLTLTLKTDTVVTISNIAGTFVIGGALVGGTSGATATVRVVSSGYLLVDNVVGTFQVGETVTSGGASGVVGDFRSEGISFGRVVATNSLAPGRSEDMIDVITADDVDLDFTGFADGVYYVILTASFEVGQTTSAQILTRTTPPPDGATEVLVCQVTKVGVVLTVSATAPATRHEPFAFEGTRIGFMPGGSIEQLLEAFNATSEVISARQLMDGTTAPAYTPASPQTTGLPFRLNTDLSNHSMGRRLGKQGVTVQGNNFTLSGPATSTNVSGSFAARNRDFEPYRDQSPATGIAVPAGVPTAIAARASEFVDLALSGASGTFTVGLLITGATSGATAIVKAVSGSTITVGDFVGSLVVGEVVDQASPSASGTIASIDLREGAITEVSGAAATSPNVVTIIDTSTGNKPVDNNLVVYGRLVYGPGGSGNPGELSLAAGQQLNFAAGSGTVVVGAGVITTPAEIDVGDIVEGADGRFYEVATITGSPNITSFTLPVTKPYVGPTVVNSGSRRRRRFILEFKKVVAGVETAATLPAGTYQFFFPAWFTLEKSNYDASQKAAAAGGQPFGVRAEKGGAGTTNLREIVNFIEGSNVSITVGEAGGKITVTIGASVGTSFPGFGPSAPPADGGAGSTGSSGLAAQSDHQHPVSSAYRPASYQLHSFFATATPIGASLNIPITAGVTPRALICVGNAGAPTGTGIGISTVGSQQAYVQTSAAIPSSFSTGHVLNTGTGTSWAITQFSPSVDVILTQSGAGSANAAFMIIGDG